ncbi:hypothetical protein PGTUg99_032771 [Puccinia graminis f. sp. tritici]|uniref:Uncharacterized protein n=1 Tax=Puccinia graminis f. sp. tritici TaxID=56615 RepID=A0A5B0NJX5_PUCGR|nr:hypothetical protein PGTUg99_032771 [Puccinia graminis f. sp. tritici]
MAIGCATRTRPAVPLLLLYLAAPASQLIIGDVYGSEKSSKQVSPDVPMMSLRRGKTEDGTSPSPR